MIIRLMDNGREYKAPGSGQSEDTIHLFLSAPESDERQLLQQIPQKIRAGCSLHQMIVKELVMTEESIAQKWDLCGLSSLTYQCISD